MSKHYDMGYYRILKNATKCYEILQDTIRYYKILQNSIECYRMLWDFIKSYKILKNVKNVIKGFMIHTLNKMLQKIPKSSKNSQIFITKSKITLKSPQFRNAPFITQIPSQEQKNRMKLEKWKKLITWNLCK